MSWPKATDYNEVVQDLRAATGDVELQGGEVARNPLGLPLLWSGNFADVYKIHCPATGNTWALKCFTRQVRGLHERYRHIAAHLEQARLPFTVDFQYLDEGLRIRGQWYPALKMRWVQGLTLSQYVEEHLDRPANLKLLLAPWVKMAAMLRQAGVAHADLQHGNVLLVPQEQNALALRLIDYDGMYVPALAGTRSGELGHPAYQHPQRLRDGTYSPDVDRFPHLAIYTALTCLAVGRRPLWERFNNGDNLLFRETDFRNPQASELFRALWSLSSVDALALTGRLVLATQKPLDQVPWLDEITGNGQVLPLSAAEKAAVNALLVQREPAAVPPVPHPPAAATRAAAGLVELDARLDPRAATQAQPVPPRPWWQQAANATAAASRGGSPPAAPGAASATASHAIPAPAAPPPLAATYESDAARRGILIAAITGGLAGFVILALLLAAYLHLQGEAARRQQAQQDARTAATEARQSAAAAMKMEMPPPSFPRGIQLQKNAADAVEPCAQRLEAAITAHDATLATSLLAQLQTLSPRDTRLAGFGERVGALMPPELAFDLGPQVKLQMVLIPAGSFLMGSAESVPPAPTASGRAVGELPVEQPQHRVQITQPFYLGKYEVTQEQWDAVLGSNQSHFKGPRNPVETVSWEDCQSFLGKLNAMAGGSQGMFVLPTEAQWEYACRAGSTTRYFFGDDEGPLGDYAWHTANSERTTHPVGEKKPNAWGLFDMYGNVSEWCSDWIDTYEARYYAASPIDDPPGPPYGWLRQRRGGSWRSPAGACRSAYRLCYPAQTHSRGSSSLRFDNLGLRVCRVGAEQARQAAAEVAARSLRLQPIAPQTVAAGRLLSFVAELENANAGPGPLQFSLAPGAPPGAFINPQTGNFTWMPGMNQVPDLHVVEVCVETPDGRKDQQSVAITVTPSTLLKSRMPSIAKAPTQHIPLTSRNLLRMTPEELFNRWDANHDGRVTLDELKASMPGGDRIFKSIAGSSDWFTLDQYKAFLDRLLTRNKPRNSR